MSNGELVGVVDGAQLYVNGKKDTYYLERFIGSYRDTHDDRFLFDIESFIELEIFKIRKILKSTGFIYSNGNTLSEPEQLEIECGLEEVIRSFIPNILLSSNSKEEALSIIKRKCLSMRRRMRSKFWSKS